MSQEKELRNEQTLGPTVYKISSQRFDAMRGTQYESSENISSHETPVGRTRSMHLSMQCLDAIYDLFLMSNQSHSDSDKVFERHLHYLIHACQTGLLEVVDVSLHLDARQPLVDAITRLRHFTRACIYQSIWPAK